MTDARLRAAIVGLGQVGLLFDEEAERSASGEIWTHFTAYQRLAQYYDLVAAVDPDLERQRIALRRHPSLRVYRTLEEMLDKHELDVVSICTPDATHLELAEALVGRCRGIFMEKPIAGLEQLQEAAATVQRIRTAGISFRVNFYKRQEPMVRLVRETMGDRRIASIVVKYSGPFLAVGSHALNLLLQFLPEARTIGAVRHPHAEGDGYSGFLAGPSGSTGQLLYCGPRHALNFSAEILHEGGSFCIERNLSRLRRYAYRPSERYKGYRELEFDDELSTGSGAERFVDFLAEIAAELSSGQRDHSSLEDALATQQLMSAISRHAVSAEGHS